jgi:drug/metabolite transporter (DMT)-like permease
VVARAVQGILPPIGLAFWRWAIALCALAPFAWKRMWAERDAVRRHWKTMAVLGILGVGSFNTLVYVGLGSTSATNGLLLNSSIPVLIVLIGWLFLGQSVGALQALGVLLSLGGVATIIFRGDLHGLLHMQFSKGDLWIFAAMVNWAVYTVLLPRRPASLSALSFLGWTMVIGLAANLPFYLAELARGARPHWTLASAGAMAYIGIFPSVVAYLFWNRAVADVGPHRAGIFIHLMPVFGTALAVLLLGETFHAYHGAGIGLILAGIMLATRAAAPMRAVAGAKRPE